MRAQTLNCLAMIASLACSTNAQEVCRVSVVASFLSRDSKTPHAPIPFAFEAKVQGKPALIKRVVPAYHPKRAVIVFDLSGSMQDKIPAAKMLALGMLRMLPADMRIGFLTFADTVANLIGVGEHRGEVQDLVQRIDRRNAHGRTAAMDAIARAIQMLEPTQPGDLIYLISDGGDNRSRISQSSFEKLMLAKRVRLLTALFWDFKGRTPEELNGPDLFDHISERSAGIFMVTSPIRDDVISTLDQLAQYVNWSYLLEVESPQSIRSQKIELSALDESRRKLDRFRLQYPHQLECNGSSSASAR